MNRKTIINRPLDIFRKAMLFLLLCVLIASCSKEDVITEETGITGTPHFQVSIYCFPSVRLVIATFSVAKVMHQLLGCSSSTAISQVK